MSHRVGCLVILGIEVGAGVYFMLTGHGVHGVAAFALAGVHGLMARGKEE